MLYQEFIERTGMELPEEKYDEVEKMYNEASGDIDKDIFCKDFKAHGDSVLLNDFYQQSLRLKEWHAGYATRTLELVNLLLEKAQLTSDEDLYRKAIELVGHAEVIRRKIKLNLSLWEPDMQYINKHLK